MDRWMFEWFLFPGLFIWRCDCATIVHGTKNNILLYTARFLELAKMNIPLHQVDMANITWGWSSSYPQEPKNHCTLQRRWVWMCVFCSVFLDLQFPPVTWDPSLGMPMKEMREFPQEVNTSSDQNPKSSHEPSKITGWFEGILGSFKPWLMKKKTEDNAGQFFIPNKLPNQPGSLLFFCGAERVSSLEEKPWKQSYLNSCEISWDIF